MNFKKAIYISFAVHIAILGSAIAFAEFSRGAFGQFSESIMVSLVGSEDSSGRKGKVLSLSKRSMQDSPSLQNPDAMAKLGQERSTPSQEEGRDRIAGIEKQTSAGSDGSAKNPGTGNDGGKSGFIPPEKWQLIQTAIEKVKRYPRIARERGIEGIVQLRFRLRPSGGVEKVEILKSSGYKILDADSISTVQRAIPEMPFVQGWIDVPIAYVLK